MTTDPMTTSHHRRDHCQLCGSKALTLILSLAPTPPANAFIPESALDEAQERFPLDVFHCEDCHHTQLTDVVDPAVLFENYVYVSGTSPAFVRHFEDYAGTVSSRFSPPAGSLVVDIGSNDGTLLKFFKDAGHDVLGIDPAKDIAANATAQGIETLARFFTPDLAREIVASRGKASVVTANNVFAHADDLLSIAQAVEQLLSPEGVFVFEVSYLVDVFEDVLFDTIYHEHMAYHAVGPLLGFFERAGLELFAASRIPSHGGSLRGFVQRAGGPHRADGSVDELLAVERGLKLDSSETLKDFAARIDRLGKTFNGVLEDLVASGKTIAGYGAPAKATTLLYHFGIAPGVLEFIVDDSPLKQGLYSPGLHIPIVPADVLLDRMPDVLVILAWNFADVIMEKNAEFQERGGRFLIPVPEVRLCP
jgi:SAM-dependent methyltransferase